MSKPVYNAAAEEAAQQLEVFDIPNPVYLMAVFNDAIRSGRATLYPWQVEAHKEFSKPVRTGTDDYVRMCICANNGAGKSQFIVAPCAVWAGMTGVRTQVVITSASGNQIDNQVGRAIDALCREVNRKFGYEVWKLNYRKYTCVKTGSIIDLYATDEAGRAEGYHPIDIGGKFVIIVDEAKSIHEDIFKALSRCTGCTHRLDVSSPGPASGYFYDMCTSGRVWFKQVTYSDCPRHITSREVDEARITFGENSAFFRSAFLAEFTSLGEQVVITLDNIKQLFSLKKKEALKDCPSYLSGQLCAGLDLSATAGGDESVLVVFDGCKQIALETFRFDDTTLNADHCVSLFRKYKLSGEMIYADDGGVGKGILDYIRRVHGYEVNRCLNQHKAYNTSLYGNRGAEMWFSLARWIQEGYLDLIDDDKTKQQLAFRYYTQHQLNAKIVLESKKEARAKGHKSPDRADAVALAFSGRPFAALYSSATDEEGVKLVAEKAAQAAPSLEELAGLIDKVKFRRDEEGNPTQFGSLTLEEYNEMFNEAKDGFADGETNDSLELLNL